MKTMLQKKGIMYYVLCIMYFSSVSIAETIDCPLISNQNDMNCDTTNQTKLYSVSITLTKENNKYGWDFPNCEIILNYHLFKCTVLSTGKEFYIIAGFYLNYDSEKCSGFDSLLNSNPLLVTAVLLNMATELVMKDLNLPIRDCNEEEQLSVVPFWRDCYSIATYKNQYSGSTIQVLLSCEGEAQCCAVYTKCYDSQQDRVISNFVLDYPSSNIFCPDYPNTIPNINGYTLINVSKCERMCDVMEQFLNK